MRVRNAQPLEHCLHNSAAAEFALARVECHQVAALHDFPVLQLDEEEERAVRIVDGRPVAAFLQCARDAFAQLLAHVPLIALWAASNHGNKWFLFIGGF